MVPLVPERLPDLSEHARLHRGGPSGPHRVARRDGKNWPICCAKPGADVTLHWQPGGHGLSRDEAAAAAIWLGS